MNLSRRQLLTAAGAAVGGSAFLGKVESTLAAVASSDAVPPEGGPYVPVVTPNGSSLPWTLKDGVKEYRLVAEPVEREFAPGMTVHCWGYNGQTPGPTLEAVEGDRVRIFVTNKLPEATSVHWHGILLPNGMDGVAGLTQPPIDPGETYVYEFTLRQNGTYMYHPHADEMVQMALGMMGFFVIHPRRAEGPKADRDFALFLAEWAIDPGTYRPNPAVMLDFNTFTFNSRAFPGTDPLVAKLGQRVRLRLANLSMDSHPIHLHGHRFQVVGTDGGAIPEGARWFESVIDVAPGTTRTVEFVADNPGDWALHCHKTHHAMNAMGHGVPNVIGVDQEALEKKMRKLVPGAMAMGSEGMGDMAGMGMKGPKNTLPMMGGDGPFGSVGMGGMFTVVKIRESLASYADPGWYAHPAGTQARKVDPA